MSGRRCTGAGLIGVAAMIGLAAMAAAETETETETRTVNSSRTANAAGPVNVVLIVFDDLGWGDLPSQFIGEPGYAMPNVARLEAEGTRFTHFLVSQPVCSASRASILTGCYANRVGINGALGPGSRIGLHPDETTVAEIAADHGHATAGLGKWHLGHRDPFIPVRHGFESWYGIPYSNDMWSLHPESPLAWPDGVPLFDAQRDPATGAVTVESDTIVTMHDQAKLTAELTRRATAFIEASAEAGRPFFLYYANPQPHVPLAAGAAFRGRTSRGLFGDVMEELDWSVGEIMRALESTGQAERTLIILTSDNGPWLSYGDHAGSTGGLREGKGTSWEGGVRVPCVVRWPGVVPAGRVDDTPWMTIDLLPTIAEAIGASADTARPIDGRSAMPLLRGDPNAASPGDSYLQYYHRGALEAVRSGHWKLVLPHRYRTMDDRPVGRGGIPGFYGPRTAERALFDLAADRAESRDQSAQAPGELARLLEVAERARADLGDSLTERSGTGTREPGRVEDDS